MTLIAVFVIVFVAGPLIFRALTNDRPSRRGLHRIAAFAVVCAVTALVIRYGFAHRWENDLVATAVSVLFIWLGWIGILALATQALRQTDPGVAMRRWTGVLGTVATTIPWFGLAWASHVTA